MWQVYTHHTSASDFLQFVYIFVSNMNQGQILSNESKMAVRSQMADQNQIFWHDSESIQHFFNPILHSFGVSMKFCWKKVFQKIQDGGWNGWQILTQKSRFGCFWTSQWAFENPTFSPVVHRYSRPSDGQKSISLIIF
jgi:hypothetical protein